MTSIEQMQLRSREVSILFMRKEHADTLKGLHNEIHRLQQKCSELQFKAAMDATYSGKDDDYKAKLEETTSKCNQQKQQLTEIEELADKRDRRIKNLEQQVRALERKHTDEIKDKKKIIQTLQSELTDKSDQIAHMQVAPLTCRTHAHAYTLDKFTPSIKAATAKSVSGSPNNRLVDQFLDMNLLAERGTHLTGAHRMCTPPAENHLSRESSTGSSSHYSSDFNHHEQTAPHGVTAYSPLPPAGRPTSGGSSSSGSAPKASSLRHRRQFITSQHFPDITGRPTSAKRLDDSVPVGTDEILRIAREQRVKLKVAHKTTDHVIPPIKANSSSSSASLRQPHSRRTAATTPANTTQFAPKSSAGSSGSLIKKKTTVSGVNLQVETLAVDQVINSDAARKSQRFNNYSGTDS